MFKGCLQFRRNFLVYAVRSGEEMAIYKVDTAESLCQESFKKIIERFLLRTHNWVLNSTDFGVFDSSSMQITDLCQHLLFLAVW